MGIFDYFIKKHKKETVDSKSTTAKESTIAPIKQYTSSMYEGILTEGELLKKVYARNIQNGTFIIPEHIKSIDMFAFSNLPNLHTIIMHDGVRFVAPNAFQGCNNLTEIIGLENSKTMKTINGYNSCINLKNIKLPQNITSIDSCAFADCKNLFSINLPDGCWFISSQAFAGCENLQAIEIPASVEMIDTLAFAGCKNLTITFLDDNKKYLQDVIKEQDEIEKQYLIEMGNDYDIPESNYSETSISNEEQKALYDDLGIKYREITIDGKNILWTPGKIIIKPNALAGVKEVIAYNPDTIQTIMKSGYKGKITFVDREKQETISIDIPAMKDYQSSIISENREKYYKQTLIPSGGTLNWLDNCKKRNYQSRGYTNNVVCDIPISLDSHICVADHLQPLSTNSQYSKEYSEFFTSVTFYKKELDNHSVYAPHEYERSYSVYFPFGARFDESMLLQIGTSLSGLIDKARDLPNTSESMAQLIQIQSKQKDLIELLLTGTNNKDAVSQIMQGITLPKPTNQIKEAIYKKDWLPYFSDQLFNELENKEKNKTSQNKDEDSLIK